MAADVSTHAQLLTMRLEARISPVRIRDVGNLGLGDIAVQEGLRGSGFFVQAWMFHGVGLWVRGLPRPCGKPDGMDRRQLAKDYTTRV